MRVTHRTYEQVFSTVYLALMTNLLLLTAGFGFVAVLVGTDVVRTWPLLMVLAPFTAPGLTAAFTVYARFSDDGAVQVVRTFSASWRATFRRATALGAMVTVAVVVLAVDVRAVWGSRVGAVAIPVFVTLAFLVVATGMLALVAIADRPDARLRDLVKASAYLGVRRWYLTAFSLAIGGVLVAVVAARPAVGLGLAAAPLLYAVWANCRFALRPVLDLTTTPASA